MATIHDFARMCNYYEHCEGCPFDNNECDCDKYLVQSPDNSTKIIDKWITDHPIKTYASNFYDKFPNAKKDKNNCPEMCLVCVYGGECPYDNRFVSGESCGENYCKECWNRELPQTTKSKEEDICE